ncbi:MAG: dephospho-CoA kinase, partial [Planctomycetaceae bacterium]|nr:dephospho-CoA kinase [Planctomycetaceae bacterium]
MPAVKIPVIGIVGGIGSGKSSLAHGLSDFLRCHRLDGDQVGHAVLQQPEVISQLCEQFGESILNEDRHIDRPSVAKLVFGTGETETRNRRQLEAIVHPRIRKRLQEELDSVRRRGNLDVIILDAPLLLEAHWDELCDAVVFVDVDRETRLQRVLNRKWTEDQFAQREQSQLPLEEKRKRADVL